MVTNIPSPLQSVVEGKREALLRRRSKPIHFDQKAIPNAWYCASIYCYGVQLRQNYNRALKPMHTIY
jgi:hypothetical protein